MIVAIEMVILILFTMDSKYKWLWLPLFAAGLVVAHYTTTYLWMAMFAGSGIVMLTYSSIKRKLISNTITVCAIAVIILGMTLVWYNGHSEVNAANYASQALNKVGVEIGEIVESVTVNVPVEGTVTRSLIISKRSWKIDMIIAQSLLAVRLLLSIVILIVLWRSKMLWNVVGVLMIGRVVGLILSYALGSVETAIGILRVGFIVFPVEIIGIAYWWGKERQDKKILPILGMMAIIYH